MNVLRPLLKRSWLLLTSEDGPSATEYAIMLAVIALVAMGAIEGIGSRIYNVYASINSAMPANV
jgi:pilus assembly protein Flp/PilA